ncbi:hypothetical protein DPMN_122058 [Dreissena polymorpha]|uniref:Uncharacterized protein n=1 Tax=Dreissena polymorpha TaxID=45954 RepID=A0A9D4JU46_DREPO|nr:hypothetical protein DPMN_122058 [Dreissena polymorpha]
MVQERWESYTMFEIGGSWEETCGCRKVREVGERNRYVEGDKRDKGGDMTVICETRTMLKGTTVWEDGF